MKEILRPIFVFSVLAGVTAARAQDAAAVTSTNAAAAVPTSQPTTVSAPANSLPTIFVCGDSTAKNTGINNSGLDRGGLPVEGWGTPIADYFDPTKAKVSNVAHAGTSSRTYYNGDWPRVLPNIHTGDYVLLVFGINDGTTPGGLGDEVNGQGQHTYGWYMSKMATDAREKGAQVYLLTVTARNIWSNPNARFTDATIVEGSQNENYDPKDDRIERGTGRGVYTQWTKDVGSNLGLPVLDLTNLEADKYEKMGRETVNKLYSDHNHTRPDGADFIAATIVSGLKAFKNSPFIPLFSEKGRAVEAAEVKYVAENQVAAKATGGAAATTASAALLGQAPNAMPVNPNLPTLWLIGDSTVRNGRLGDGSESGGQWGWGAPLEYFFDLSKINVVNRALGGTSSRTFYNSNWPRVAENLKKGDFVIMQFGHNDNNGNLTNAQAYRASINGAGEETQDVPNRSGQPETVHTFGWYLKQMIAEARAKGATPIVCSLIPRKIWADGKIVRTNENYFDYGAWAAQVAKAENAPFINLNEITARKYDAMGEAKVEPLFVPTPTEHTHTDWYGAVINAESVIGGLKALKDNPLAPYFSARGAAVPAAELNP